jgi:peptidoglycan/LPS O-acetylase OafA/YrhL
MKFMKIAGKTLAIAAGLALTAGAALAASLGGIADTAANQNFLSLNNFITGGMYLAGVGLGAAGVFKLRDHIKEPDRTPLKMPLGFLVAASCALALPSYLRTGVDTTFGTGQATINDLRGSQLGR